MTKNTIIFYLIFCIPFFATAQNIQEKKSYNDKGELIELAKITKIDEETDALEITAYAPDNTGLPMQVTNFIAVKGKKNNNISDAVISHVGNSALADYLKTSALYLHGKAVRYHGNGKIKDEEHYVHGNRHGEAAEYDTDGSAISKGSYAKNNKEGEWILYFVTDNKYYRKGLYKSGKKQGVWGLYLTDGTLIAEEKFIDGELDDHFVPSVKPPPMAGPCPNPKKLRGLCAVVGDLTEDSNPQGKYKYVYQRRIFEAACVDVNKDSEEEIARKVSKVWKENEDQLICNNTAFEVGNGNIIKFAVDSTFDSFISDMAIWKVNLNKVDATDGRTVLDYVKYQLEKAKGTPSERRISLYYSSLRRAGAKHKSEL